MQVLFSTTFKNGYVVVVKFDGILEVYKVDVWYYLDATDRHTTEFYNAREVYGYMADVQSYKPKEE